MARLFQLPVTTQPTALPILIVEDDAPTQLLLRTVLRRCGYESEVAVNGREAITLLQNRTYAAVVLDMMMPDVGGDDVIAYIGATQNPAGVIVCSAAGPSVLSGFDPRVVKAVIRKPFDIEQLIAAVTSTAGSR